MRKQRNVRHVQKAGTRWAVLADGVAPAAAWELGAFILYCMEGKEAGLLSATEQAKLADHSEVSAAEQSQLAVVWEEEALQVTGHKHLHQAKALPPLGLTWGRFCCPSEALESLTWLCSCQQYTFAQDVICFPREFPEEPHLHSMFPKAV